jgi:type IV secretory pathway component VirB8
VTRRHQEVRIQRGRQQLRLERRLAAAAAVIIVLAAVSLHALLPYLT